MVRELFARDTRAESPRTTLKPRGGEGGAVRSSSAKELQRQSFVNGERGIGGQDLDDSARRRFETCVPR